MSGPVDEALPWFKWYRGATGNWKVRRLARLLKNPCAGVFWVARLWEFTAEAAPADGNLGHLDPEEFEALIGWTGTPGELFASLTSPDVRLLDTNPLRVHQWIDHQPGILEARGLGKRATERAAERLTTRPIRLNDETIAEGSSEYFQRFWVRVPKGKRKAMSLTYEVWRRHGLDDPSPAGDQLRDEVYRTFDQQLRHGSWADDFMKRGHVLGYMRRKDWEGWDLKPELPIAVHVVNMPTPTRDDTELRRDWSALASSKGREWPGYDQAMSEVITAKQRGDN